MAMTRPSLCYADCVSGWTLHVPAVLAEQWYCTITLAEECETCPSTSASFPTRVKRGKP
jgi:hypothetical protein